MALWPHHCFLCFPVPRSGVHTSTWTCWPQSSQAKGACGGGTESGVCAPLSLCPADHGTQAWGGQEIVSHTRRGVGTLSQMLPVPLECGLSPTPCGPRLKGGSSPGVGQPQRLPGLGL